MLDLISGAMITGYAVAGLFFLRFWRHTRDRLFLIFSLAFWLLAIQRLGIAIATPGLEIEGRTQWYVVRLLAFVLILYAIIDKNRGRDPSR